MGGMQRVSMQLIEQLKSDKSLEVIELTQETGWKYIGIKSTLFLIRLCFSLPKYVKESNADIILFSSMVTASIALITRKRISIPMVTITHGHDVKMKNFIYQWFVPRIFNALDSVISVSSATQQACLSRGLEPRKSKVLPNGFDERELRKTFNKLESVQFLEDAFGCSLKNKKILLTVGRLIKRKGHEWFITEVMPLIRNNIFYIIIGDGPEFKSISNAVVNASFGDNILLTGRQPDDILEHAYVAADLFVMPNIKVPGDMEGFGVVLLEANIRQTPAIASDIEGIRDVIANGKNGYRITLGDSHTYAEKIDEVLDTELDYLSKSSKEYAIQQFSWNTVGQSYINFLRQVRHNNPI